MSLERVLLALSNPATYAFLVGWALAELRGWVAHRVRLRLWRREAEQTLNRQHGGPLIVYDVEVVMLDGDPAADPAHRDDMKHDA